MSKTEQDDYPEIGKRRRGMVLVCHGDDRPDQFADWLQPLVDEFNRLYSIAYEHNVDMDPQDGSPSIVDILDFCQRLGIEFSSNMWEGFLISGTYYLGWIEFGTVRSTKAYGKKLIQSLERHVDGAVRSAVQHELERINDLDEFLERTADDRSVLHGQIASLHTALNITRKNLDQAQSNLEKKSQENSSAIDLACIRLVCELLSGEKHRIVAGPLVLWDDGIVYAICSWGGNAIPAGSSPALLLEALEKSGRTIVRVKEATVIGGWTSGPIYRKGPAHINGWSDVWSLREERQRNFVIEPPSMTENVRQIHEQLAQGIT